MPDICERFDLRRGQAVALDCTHDCDVLWLDEMGYARWQKTGEPVPDFVHSMPLRLTASHDGPWHLVVWYCSTSGEDIIDESDPSHTLSVHDPVVA